MPVRPAGTFLLAALVGLGASACASTQEPSVATVTPDGPVIQPGAPGEASTTHTGPITLIQPEPNAADVFFVKSMVVHHAQALQLVDAAEDGLSDPQVRAIAERIRAAQAPELTVMVAWLTQADELVPPEAVDAGIDVEGLGGEVGARPRTEGHDHGGTGEEGMAGMATPEQVQELDAAEGAAADRLFLELMTAHHEGALEMVTEHGARGIDPRARELSDEMFVEQTAEIGRMAELLDRLAG